MNPRTDFAGPPNGAGRDALNVLGDADWRAERIADYFERHELPSHPLSAEGYGSIGCRPCTTPVSAGEDARAGRWRGSGKTECGIHFGGGQGGGMAIELERGSAPPRN